MKSLLLAAVLGTAMGGCSTATAQAPFVALFFEFQTQPADQTIVEMQAEVERAYKTAGVRFTWRDLNGFRTGETFPEVFVIKFRGECSLRGCLLGFREGPVTKELKPLGYAAMSDGQVLPFATIECDRVRETITPSAVSLADGDRRKLIGRALGRVVAHELYHMITRSTKHSRNGIVKSYHTRIDLVSEDLTFEDDQIEKLRTHASGLIEMEVAGGGF